MAAGIYIAPNQSDNSTYEDASLYAVQRKRVRLNSLGLFLQTTAGKFVPEESFLLNSDVQQAIANKTKMCFVVKYVDRPENESSASAGESDDYVNVGQNLQLIKNMYPNLTGAIDRMIANDYPGMAPEERMSRIEGMDGVLDAKNDAVNQAWYEPIN